jgi:putative transposase
MGLVPGAKELWVDDVVAMSARFAYFTIGLAAKLRLGVGFGIWRILDTRLAMAGLQRASELRGPRPGCIHHSDRGGDNPRPRRIINS